MPKHVFVRTFLKKQADWALLSVRLDKPTFSLQLDEIWMCFHLVSSTTDGSSLSVTTSLLRGLFCPFFKACMVV